MRTKKDILKSIEWMLYQILQKPGRLDDFKKYTESVKKLLDDNR